MPLMWSPCMWVNTTLVTCSGLTPSCSTKTLGCVYVEPGLLALRYASPCSAAQPLSMRVTAATPAVHDDCCCRRDCRVRVPCQMYIGSLLTCELLRAFGYISELFSKALLLLRCARMRRLLKARQPLRWQQPEIRKMIPAGAPRYTAQAGTQGAHRPAVAPDFRVLIVVHVRARHPGLPKEPLRRR